ncbi:MAG: zinc finger domain-containing protein [archaeon]
MTTCTSCGANLQAENKKAEFKCPQCSEVVIGRCERCKKLSRTYTCSGCGFVGP